MSVARDTGGTVPPQQTAAVALLPDAWEHRADLVAYARRVLGDAGASAEDVVQEAFLRLAEQDALGRRPRETRPWLFRVVRNLALDERRRTVHVSDAEIIAFPAPGSAPAEVYERREAARRTLHEVAALPPRERRAVVMEQAGIGAGEIARELSTTPNAVHQALFRARKRLRTARAGVWGVLPLPLARFAMRIGETRVPEMLTTAGGGDGSRMLPVAGVLGATVAGLIGGGAAIQHLSHEPVTISAERGGRIAAPASGTGARTALARGASGAGTPARRAPGAAPGDDGAHGARGGGAPGTGSGDHDGSDDVARVGDRSGDRSRSGDGSSGSGRRTSGSDDAHTTTRSGGGAESEDDYRELSSDGTRTSGSGSGSSTADHSTATRRTSTTSSEDSAEAPAAAAPESQPATTERSATPAEQVATIEQTTTEPKD